METVFSKDVQAGLDQARIAGMKRASRLRVHVGTRAWPVLRMWKTGFAMADDAPQLRGFVNLHDGAIHLFRCLIVATDEEAGERRYEFKRATAVSDRAAVDFEILETAPVALIEGRRR